MYLITAENRDDVPFLYLIGGDTQEQAMDKAQGQSIFWNDTFIVRLHVDGRVVGIADCVHGIGTIDKDLDSIPWWEAGR